MNRGLEELAAPQLPPLPPGRGVAVRAGIGGKHASHQLDAPNDLPPQHLPRLPDEAMPAQIEAHQGGERRTPRPGDQPVAVDERQRDRLLEEDVPAGLQSREGDLDVKASRNADRHRLDLGIGEERRGVRMATWDLKGVSQPSQALGIDICRGDDLDVGDRAQGGKMAARGHDAAPDDAEPERPRSIAHRSNPACPRARRQFSTIASRTPLRQAPCTSQRWHRST